MAEMPKAPKENVHKGHRERMKKRFLEDGADIFETHQLLEMLLFYSVPRQDTNETAHNLLNKFGTLERVMSADYKELIKIKGIKENSATLIRLVSGLLRKAMVDSADFGKIYDSFDSIAEYLVNLYMGLPVERAYALLFDNSLHLIETLNLGDGLVNKSELLPRKILEKVVEVHASSVVLAHNHPNGMAIPSTEDINSTNSIDILLKAFQVNLLDHILVAGDTAVSIMSGTHGNFRPTSLDIMFNGNFYKTYYREVEKHIDKES